MGDEIRAAHIQGKYSIVGVAISSLAVVIAAYLGVHNTQLSANIDTLQSEKTALSDQIVELTSELENAQISYAKLEAQNSQLSHSCAELETQKDQLNQSYTELESKYRKLLDEVGKADPTMEPIKEIAKRCWLDQLDVFFFEGKHISGSTSDGWCRNWDSTLQKDSLGAEHNHGICVRGYREDISIIDYIPDDTYTGLKGTFTLEYESRNVQIESYVKFYSINSDQEKTLLYSVEQPLSGGIPPISFDFPVNGTDHLRIEISSGAGNSGEFLLALVDTCFYK